MQKITSIKLQMVFRFAPDSYRGGNGRMEEWKDGMLRR
jgi:hypothetical protein